MWIGLRSERSSQAEPEKLNGTAWAIANHAKDAKDPTTAKDEAKAMRSKSCRCSDFKSMGGIEFGINGGAKYVLLEAASSLQSNGCLHATRSSVRTLFAVRKKGVPPPGVKWLTRLILQLRPTMNVIAKVD